MRTLMEEKALRDNERYRQAIHMLSENICTFIHNIKKHKDLFSEKINFLTSNIKIIKWLDDNSELVKGDDGVVRIK